jgi:MFS family permease
MQPMSNYLGENKAMFILDVFAIISILLQAYSVNILTLYIGRFLLGIYVGISSGIIPVYLVSISPPEVSGIIGSFNQLLITIGIAAAYGLGYCSDDLAF